MGENEERREDVRREVHWPISVQTATGTVSGETLNISTGGLSICCEDPLPLETELQISVLPPDHQIINLTGRIAWSDLTGIDEEDRAVGMGLCFVEIDPKDREFFEKVVSENTDD